MLVCRAPLLLSSVSSGELLNTVGSIGSDFGAKAASYAISKAALTRIPPRTCSCVASSSLALFPARANVQRGEGEAGDHDDLDVPGVAPDRRVQSFLAVPCCPCAHTDVRTDLGGPNAILPVSVGVEGVLKSILSLKPEDRSSTSRESMSLGKYEDWRLAIR